MSLHNLFGILGKKFRIGENELTKITPFFSLTVNDERYILFIFPFDSEEEKKLKKKTLV